MMFKFYRLIFILSALLFIQIACTNEEKSVIVYLHPIKPDSLKYIENIPLWPKESPAHFYKMIEKSKKSVRVGVLNLDGESYQIGIINLFSDTYKISSELWIDLGKTRTYDYYKDHLETMLVPFTIGNFSYNVTEVDSLGNFVKIKILDPQLNPPITVGLPAPNFKTVKNDSTIFQLTDLKGKNIFLYFWTCNPQNHIKHVHKAIERLKDTNYDLEIVCIGAPLTFDANGNIDRHLSNTDTQVIPLNWTHVLAKGMWDNNRKLYQVGNLMKSFIIDKEGFIRSIDKPVTEDEIFTVIKNYFESI